MPTIKVRNTPQIQLVLKLYEKAKSATITPEEKKSMDKSVMVKENKQGWLSYFGLKYRSADLQGVEYPVIGQLSQLSLEKQQEAKGTNIKHVKENCNFFNYTYNTAARYIEDNQKRFFGRANMEDNSHAKTIAMVFVAHLCKRGIESNQEAQENIKKRILSFTQSLNETDFIQSTTSNDSQLLSLPSALNRIKHYFTTTKKVQNKTIDLFYKKIDDTQNNIEVLLKSLFEFHIPIFIHEQPGGDIESLLNKKSPSSNEKAIVNSHFFLEYFKKPYTTNKEDQGYEELFKGIDYNFKALKNNKRPFLVTKFNDNQLKNLKNLLQYRDKLRVLKDRLKDIYDVANQNQTTFLDDLIRISEPLLKEINRSKSLLQISFEQFVADCYHVYRQRSEEPLTNPRTDWETQFNKSDQEPVRSSIIKLSKTVNEAFLTIPYNHFDALSQFQKNSVSAIQKSAKLLGINFDKQKGHINQTVETAQVNELTRQAELMLIKQKDLAEEYADLIKKAKQSDDINLSPVIQLLVTRKAALEEVIQKIEKGIEQEKLEDGWVILDIEPETFEVKDAGLFKAVSEYLSATFKGQGEIKKLNESLKKALGKNKELLSDNKKLKDENKVLKFKLTSNKVDNEQLNKFRDAQIQINSLAIITAPNKLLLSNKLANNAITPTYVNGLKNILDNCHNIILQANEYKKSYIDNAGGHDNSIFFSHNNHGKGNAQNKLHKWTHQVKALINQQVNLFLNDDEDNNINEFKNKLDTMLVKYIRHLSKHETYSSYKKHSFRNYMHALNEQFINNEGGLKIDLTIKNSFNIKNKSDIHSDIENDEEFKSENLKAFTKELKT